MREADELMNRRRTAPAVKHEIEVGFLRLSSSSTPSPPIESKKSLFKKFAAAELKNYYIQKAPTVIATSQDGDSSKFEIFFEIFDA